MDDPTRDNEPARTESELIGGCRALIADRKAEAPDEDLWPTDADRLLFEAQVLLVCEEIHRGNMTDRLIRTAVVDIRERKQDDILEIVRQRLFEQNAYSARLRNVETVFQQLIRGDMDRTVTRPAKLG